MTALAIDVTEHLGIARTVARRTNVADQDDLYGAIVEALVRAERSYDPSKGTWSALAWSTAKYTALHYLRDSATTIRRSRAAFEAGEGTNSTVSVDTPIGDGTLLGDVLGAVDARIDTTELRIDLGRALATLTERERIVVLRCDVEGDRQADVGADLGVSQGEVYRIRKSALGKMRGSLAA